MRTRTPWLIFIIVFVGESICMSDSICGQDANETDFNDKIKVVAAQ